MDLSQAAAFNAGVLFRRESSLLCQRAAPHAELLHRGTETGHVKVPIDGTVVQIAEHSLRSL